MVGRSFRNANQPTVVSRPISLGAPQHVGRLTTLQSRQSRLERDFMRFQIGWNSRETATARSDDRAALTLCFPDSSGESRYPCWMTVNVWVGNTAVSPAFATPGTVCV